MFRQIWFYLSSVAEEKLLGDFGPEDGGNKAIRNVGKYNSFP